MPVCVVCLNWILSNWVSLLLEESPDLPVEKQRIFYLHFWFLAAQKILCEGVLCTLLNPAVTMFKTLPLK